MPLRDSHWVAGAAALLLVGAVGGAVWNQQRRDAHLQQRAEAMTGGSVVRGQALFGHYGCGGCHTLTGVPQAAGMVGPPLDTIGSRAMIAGKLDNTPANLERWIRDPQAVTPGTGMPNLGVTQDQSRDLAALLYTYS